MGTVPAIVDHYRSMPMDSSKEGRRKPPEWVAGGRFLPYFTFLRQTKGDTAVLARGIAPLMGSHMASIEREVALGRAPSRSGREASCGPPL